MIFANIELPILAVYLVMAVGFIVMVWGVKNLQKKSNARIIMIVGVLMVLGGVGGRFCVSAEKSEDARLEKNARLFLAAKAEKAASYIADPNTHLLYPKTVIPAVEYRIGKGRSVCRTEIRSKWY